MNVGVLSESVQKYLRASGYTQKELADALGLHPKVLSRKLNGSSNARLTHQEVRSIVTTLAGWHAITTRDEALALLEAAGVDPGIFAESAWQTPPLNTLVQTKAQPGAFHSSDPPSHARHHNLPTPTTRLIGRAWAVTRLRQLLSQDGARLITLVGPGGSGKTRLALHVASGLTGLFAQGIWYVSLAGVNDPDLVPMSIIQTLHIQSTPGLSPLQSLIAYLRPKQMLLVLDNFEQVAEAGSAIDEMLAAAPALKILITSRVVLHLYGEREFSVPPLDLPHPDSVLEPAELEQYGAIQLFVERAQATIPDFVLTSENASTIARICARVDGLPLALELAAARIKVLTPEQLLERLSRARLSILTGGARNLPDRQQTLRDTINWSYTLLSPTEQIWFRRLAIFTGSWSLEAAEAMIQSFSTDEKPWSGPHFSLDVLEQLVDNSLLQRAPAAGSEARFTMLETLREYALEQLAVHDELDLLRDWHACYYLRNAEAGELGLRGPQQRAWLARLKASHENIRAALEWSLTRAREGKRIRAFFPASKAWEVAGSTTLSSHPISRPDLPAIELCLRLAAAFRSYWEWQGYMIEGRYWLKATLDVPVEENAGETTLAARARALSEYARLVVLQNEQDRAKELAEASLAIWERLRDARGMAAARLHLGWAGHGMGDYELAARAYQEGMELISPEEDTWLYAELLFHLGAAAGFMSDYERTRSCYAQSRQLFERIGDASAVADVWKDQGGMLILESKWNESIDCLLKSIALSYELDHKQFIATALGSLSYVVGLREEPDPVTASIHSVQIQGAADSLMETLGLTPWTRTNPLAQMVRQLIRSRLTDQQWDEAWSTGHALSLEQAIELVYRLLRYPQTD
jgi:predicted ATPase